MSQSTWRKFTQLNSLEEMTISRVFLLFLLLCDQSSFQNDWQTFFKCNYERIQIKICFHKKWFKMTNRNWQIDYNNIQFVKVHLLKFFDVRNSMKYWTNSRFYIIHFSKCKWKKVIYSTFPQSTFYRLDKKKMLKHTITLKHIT